jgi:hypothetical protein
MSTKDEELIKSVAMYLYYAFERRKRYIQEFKKMWTTRDSNSKKHS